MREKEDAEKEGGRRRKEGKRGRREEARRSLSVNGQ